MTEKTLGQCVLPLIEELDGFVQLKNALHRHCVINVSGIDDSGTVAVMSALKRSTDRPFIVLCENELIGRFRAEDYNALGINAKLLPSLEVSFLKTDAASREISLQRLSALGDFATGKADVLVVPADAVLNRFMPRSRFTENIITLKDAQVVKPAQLLEKLTQAGYERLEIVESRGQCSLRGGILDVYPVGTMNAVRVEFFDDEIDSIRFFDVLTQRSLDRIDEVSIYPARELLLNKDEAADAAKSIRRLLSLDGEKEKLDRQRNIETEFDLLPYEKFFELTSDGEESDETDLPSMWELGSQSEEKPEASAAAKKQPGRLEKRFNAVIDALENGRSLDVENALFNILRPDSASIFDFMPEAVIVLEHSDRVAERCKGIRDDFLLSFKAAFERGEALGEQSELLLGYDELIPVIKKHEVITVDSFLRTQNDFPPQKLIKFECVGTPGYNSNIKELAAEITRLKAQGAYILLLAGGTARSQRLSRLLNEEELIVPAPESIPERVEKGAPVILPSNISGGFIFRELPLYVFSEVDLFGRGKHRKRTPTSTENKSSVFTQLRIGDYVVHENHGIGQYLGTVRMNVDGTYRDFLNIRYGGTDKLYVPTDQMDRIQKYIGSEGETPKLNHLSGGDWQKQKAKVRRAIKEIAGDLIKLYAARSASPGYAFNPDTPWQKEFEDNFPFEETPDQVTAIAEIKKDMEKPMVMDRLLCGDVGYGKTEVALRAVFKCVMDGKQAVLLAPTTILVQQHYATALNRFSGFPINIDTLSRFKSPAEQKEVIRKLKTGEIDFVIGTHRLLSKEIQYKDLGLLVVDEEQRFGVGHKETIKQYKKNVDVLTLSATPIPRTLHMSMVGIRDMSILKTPPDERFPIQTYVVEYSDGLVRDAILRELSRGGQVYVLYNRVQTIEVMFNRLKKLVPEARIAVAHGQMKEQNLEDVMLDFYDGKFDVLLCSTIIEAGLDVPRANTLIVCDSDRFGLSQLYQLRGRVGRSNRIAYAYLTVNPNKILTQDAEKRLNAIREFTEFGSGFRVAMRDLEIRGTGNILGAEQSGHMAAVGYDLYVKMINEAISELQGTDTVQPTQTKVELKIDAYLPTEYISADSMRIEMYKRIAEIRDEESKEDVINELIDRFGDPGKPVMNLISIARIKALCEKIGISTLGEKENGLVMKFSQEAQIDPLAFMKAVSVDKRLKFTPRGTGLLSFTEPKADTDKLLQDGIKALDQLLDRLKSETVTA